MADIYQPVRIVESSGGTPIFESTFQVSDWQLSGSNYTITVSETVHKLGLNVIVQVEELIGSFYKEVVVDVENTNGNIKITIGSDSRFVGRILIKG